MAELEEIHYSVHKLGVANSRPVHQPLEFLPLNLTVGQIPHRVPNIFFDHLNVAIDQALIMGQGVQKTVI